MYLCADKVVPEESDKADQGPDRPSTPSADEFYSARYKLSQLMLQFNGCHTSAAYEAVTACVSIALPDTNVLWLLLLAYLSTSNLHAP